MKRALFVLLASCSALDPTVGDASPPIDSGAPVLFGRDIRPLMDRGFADGAGAGCRFCHYSTETSHHGTDVTGLDLSTLGKLRLGGSNTHQNIVIPFEPSGSALVEKLRGTFGVGQRMPRNGPTYWSESDIELVERWIAQGAKGGDTE